MLKHRASLIGLSAAIAMAAMVFAAKAETVTGFIARPSEAADLKGDNNAIGVFNRDEANKSLMKVWGKITAVSDTEITILAKRDPENNVHVTPGTSYTFTIDNTTEVLRRFRALSSPAELTVGDQVRIWGTKLTDGTAKLIWDKSIWWVRLNGTISNLDSVNQTFRLLITHKGSDGSDQTFSVAVKTNDATLYANADGSGTTFSALTNGSMVRVRGVWNHMGRYLTARNIKFQ